MMVAAGVLKKLHHGGANLPSLVFPRVWWGKQKWEKGE
jgi:hypothetical protein